MNEILHNLNVNNKNNNNFHDSFNHLYCLIFKNLDTIIINSNEYIKYNPFYLSCFIIGYSNNILNMEKFPKYLTTFCGLTNINFNEVYNELWSNYKNILNNNKNNGIIRDNLYLTNDSKQSELKNNLNRVDKVDILNIENNKIPSFRKFHSKLYLNPFLDSKISLKNAKAKKNQSNDINIKKNTKYKIYSTHATKKNIPKNIHKKINNIYKFNPCLFTFNFNSTSNIAENNPLTKFKTSKCFKKSNDKITINKGIFFKNIKKYEPKDIDNLEEKKNEENKTNIVNSNNQYLKNNNSIQYIFQNKASNLFNNKKLNIEISNFNQNKLTKSKSSANWKFEKKIDNKENIKENINENNNKCNNNLISIRRCYKIKHSKHIQNIIINRSNKRNNIYTDNNNEEEKNNKLISFDKKLTENIHVFNNNNDILNKKINENQLLKITNDLGDINNKRVNIRTFYKLKNSSLKNENNIKKYSYAS